MSENRRFRLAVPIIGFCLSFPLAPCALAEDRPDLKGYWEVVSGPKGLVHATFEIEQDRDSVRMNLGNGIVLRGSLSGRKLSLSHTWTQESARTHIINSEQETGAQAGAARDAAIRALAGTKVTVEGTLDEKNENIQCTYKEQKEEAAIKRGQTEAHSLGGINEQLTLSSLRIGLRILLTPEKCRDIADQFVLDGAPREKSAIAQNNLGSSSRLTLRDNMTILGGEPYLVFRGVRPDWKYTLTVTDPHKQEDVLFSEWPYTGLKNVTRYAETDPKEAAAPPPAGFTGVKSFKPYFDPTPILKKGSGDFHLNRYRVYFRSRWVLRESSAKPASGAPPVVIPVGKQDLSALVEHFTREFPLFFNGGEMGHITDGIKEVQWKPVHTKKFWHPNLAKVAKTNLVNEEGQMFRALGFEFDAPGPNVHNDWVAIIWQDPSKGFAAQTLSRLQGDWSKTKSMATVYEGVAGSTLATGGVGLIPAFIGAGVFTNYNDDHFLAGRRSWVLGRANDEFGRVDFGGDDYYYLETGAIERYSSWVHRYLTSNAPIPDLRESIDTIWITNLRNFLSANELKPLSVPGNIGWERKEGVYFLNRSFPSLDKLQADDQAQDLLKMHPALKPE